MAPKRSTRDQQQVGKAADRRRTRARRANSPKRAGYAAQARAGMQAIPERSPAQTKTNWELADEIIFGRKKK